MFAAAPPICHVGTSEAGGNLSAANLVYYIGTGAAGKSVDFGFTDPDLVITQQISDRDDNVGSNYWPDSVTNTWYNSVRGVGKYFRPASTQDVEVTDANSLTSFNTAGSVVFGSSAASNKVGEVYCAVAFKKTAGQFDLVSRTGDGVNGTVAHALGKVPRMIVGINVTDANTVDWPVYHAGLVTPGTDYLEMNKSTLPQTDATMFNSTAPTSSVFSVGTNNEFNGNGKAMLYFLWCESDYMTFGNYTGNGSSTGPTIATPCAMDFFMHKRASGSTDNWENTIQSMGTSFGTTARIGTMGQWNNGAGDLGQEGSSCDFNPISVQIKSTNADINTNAALYVYMAFRARARHAYIELTTGSGTLTIPSGTHGYSGSIYLEAVAASGKSGTGSAGTAGGGGGGGGGSCIKNKYVKPGDTLAYSVGAGGAGNGANTTFDGMTAGGGVAGTNASAGVPGLKGTGGTASGGDTNTSGSDGTDGTLTLGGDGGAAAPNGGLITPGGTAAGAAGRFWGGAPSGGSSTNTSAQNGRNGLVRAIY